MAKTIAVEEKKPARRVVARMKTVTPPLPETSVKAAAKTFFHLKAVARPKAGGRLYAHTQATFELFGMLKGKAIARARLEPFIGMKAICHHVSIGNLAEKGADIFLTKQGREQFAKRKVDREVVDAFLSVFKTGKASPVAEVKNFQIEVA